MIPSFEKFIKEERDWIESVITFQDDPELLQTVISKLQEIGVDTGSLKSTFNAKTKMREIRVFNKLTKELNILFQKDKFAGITIKKYEE